MDPMTIPVKYPVHGMTGSVTGRTRCKKSSFTALYILVTTKFTDKDELDLDMFSVNIKAQLEAGVSGIILGGTLGEASTLTYDEKKVLMKETVQLVEGKVPVIINIAEQTTKDAKRAAEVAEECGATGLMMLPPMRYKANDYETVTYFKETANSTKLPIMIYNNPVDYVCRLPKTDLSEWTFSYQCDDNDKLFK